MISEQTKKVAGQLSSADMEVLKSLRKRGETEDQALERIIKDTLKRLSKKSKSV